MEKIVDSLLAGTLELAMSGCVLRQCGAESPIVYEGPGLITQDQDKCIQLRVFAAAAGDPFHEFAKSFNQDNIPGELMPDSHYYDFEGRDPYGTVWRAERISIDVGYGSGTYVRARPRTLQKIDHGATSIERSTVIAFLPEDIELPWHAVSDKGDRGWARDQFEKKAEPFEWKVVKAHNGVWLSFTCSGVSIEGPFDAFLRALSILTGRWLAPICLTICSAVGRQTRILNRLHKSNTDHLIPPIGSQREDADDAHRFVGKFISKASQSRETESVCDLAHRYWHRILRSRISDIENSSLVLSVAIEGFIKKTLLSTIAVDAEFLAQVRHAKPIVEKAGLGERALGRVLDSLGSAEKPSIKDVLRQLTSAGVIAKIHRVSWTALRNAAAHGALLNDDEKALQKHLDRFYVCLDLYCRLVFLSIEYDGKHTDFGTKGWPSREFCQMEPFRLSEWSTPSGRLFTCSRPGRSKWKDASLVPEQALRDWVNNLPEGRIAIISLLGRTPDGTSEYSYYPFGGGFEEAHGKPTFEAWLETHFPERQIMATSNNPNWTSAGQYEA